MLTVLIPCKDEIQHIRACIESVRPIADEILVADSGSTDGTLELVHTLGGCRIIEREYVNSADFKNWAIPQAQHAWVLVVDADERMTPELAGEIRRLFDFPPQCDGYAVRRDNFFLGHHYLRNAESKQAIHHFTEATAAPTSNVYAERAKQLLATIA